MDTTAQTGDRYFAAKFQLVNSGTGAYRDNIMGDSVVLDAAGNDYYQQVALNADVAPQFGTSHIRSMPAKPSRLARVRNTNCNRSNRRSVLSRRRQRTSWPMERSLNLGPIANQIAA